MTRAVRQPPPRLRLEEVCQRVASPTEWWTQKRAVRFDVRVFMRVGDDKPYSDLQSTDNYFDRPYIRPFLVEKVEDARHLRRQLVERAIDWLEVNHWRALALPEDKIDEVEIPLRRLRYLHLLIEDDEFSLGGNYYNNLCFMATSVDTFAELLQAVKKIAPRMDPKRHVAKHFAEELQVAFGCTYSVDAVRDAMKAANLDRGFFDKGRRSELGPGI